MQSRTFRQYNSESFAQRPHWGIGQWLYKHRRAIFIATMRAAVYSTISVSAYHIYTGSLSIYVFLENYIFPIFQEVM